MSALSELQNYTFTSKYARYIPELKRRETWREAVDRVKNMMLDKYQEYPDVHQDIEWAYDLMYKKRVLGSQRALQFGGKPVLKHMARGYNCCSSYIDRLRFFQECMYLLLCGTGTGFSVQKHHIDKLPKLIKYKNENKSFIIEDSIEGWSNAIGVLVSSYFEQSELFSEYTAKNIDFKFHKIRPEGSFLSSSSGKAPGPEPLKRALIKIKQVLDNCLLNQLFRPIDAYDIVMHSSDAVLSGGVRRSATICIFSLDDADMMSAKTGNWFEENPQRGRSNNSCLLLRNKITFKEFENIIKHSKEFGEPAFYWSDNTEQIPNPCVEISFYCYDLEGNSGWQFCNLSTINCGKIKTKDDFFEASKAAAIIGTLQAGFTKFPYLGQISENITEREALLGVSMTGIMDQHNICLDKEIQKQAAKIVKETNKLIAKKININVAARTTCVKPEGTTSCLLGTSSGIHPHHAKRYIRRVQTNRTEPVYQYFKIFNESCTQKSVWSANDTDEVISFPIEVEDGAKTKNQISALELLEIVRNTQINWVHAGRNKELCSQPWLQNNVSNTITIKQDEWEEVTKFIYNNREYFCGVSLLPESGDKDYAQAPFTTVHGVNEIIREYGDGSLWCSGLIELCLQSFGDLWVACTAILNDFFTEKLHITKTKKELKVAADQIDCWERCRKFANKYFNNDLKRLCYCLKDVYLWKDYCDLKQNFQHVDYSFMVEEEDNTKFEEQASCAGGKCELV